MSTAVMAIVLLAAFLHAGWNALVKSSPDTFLDIVFVTGSAAVISGIVLPFLPLPHSDSWPYIAASAAIHVVYFVLIGAAYRSGDMAHAYPLMRGTPPLFVALASGPIIGERLTAGEWSGILLICGGILGLLLASPSSGVNTRSTQFALLNAVAIMSYTLVDGTGVRISGSPAAYTMWVFAITALPILGWTAMHRRGAIRSYLCARGHLALVGGACTLGAYTLVLWAMTRAPIAMVAALRETAILFGAAISAFVLKEPRNHGRSAAALLILVGVMTLRLS
ncbi:EamA family transporter [Paraburkholderia acidipaludis]|uniref:EamA family transporter n=1 Tax=Paraburkholderia acidipaludis TaxID=660537 RepID=UPI0004803CB8|nr:EamA family transporter [Paraburkholderia acidipaludis]